MSALPDKIALFVPCIVDQAYPEMAWAMVDVLRALNVRVTYDPAQTCCGQPAFNAGHHAESRTVARQFLRVFQDEETVVCPSGSCTAMVRNYFPVIFAGDASETPARALSTRVFEFTEFLAPRLDKLALSKLDGVRVGFHNSCHSFRELRIERAPLEIIERITGAAPETPGSEPVCCGFGGLFSAKFGSIAQAMAASRLTAFADAGVDLLVSNDPGCIMHFRQEVEQQGLGLEVLHIAELIQRALAPVATGERSTHV